MISSLLKKVFGSRNDRLVKQYRQTVARINALESGLTGLSDEALGAKPTHSPACEERLTKPLVVVYHIAVLPVLSAVVFPAKTAALKFCARRKLARPPSQRLPS